MSFNYYTTSQRRIILKETKEEVIHKGVNCMELDNKIAIVTGGGTGIGRATSILLSQKGASVVVVYSRSEKEAVETVAIIKEQGGKAISYKTDVACDELVKDMVREVVDTFGAIHYLVNNASITKQLLFNDLEVVTDEIWDMLFNVNVKGMFHCARAVAPFMKGHGEGAIVNLGSIAGVTGLGSSLPYAVSKTAVHGLTKSLARAMAPKIRVNCIVPGAVDTRWWEGEEEKMHKLAGHLPLGKISKPEEIAQLIYTLLTARSMTGQIVIADNGQSL